MRSLKHKLLMQIQLFWWQFFIFYPPPPQRHLFENRIMLVLYTFRIMKLLFLAWILDHQLFKCDKNQSMFIINSKLRKLITFRSRKIFINILLLFRKILIWKIVLGLIPKLYLLKLKYLSEYWRSISKPNSPLLIFWWNFR